MLLIAIPKSVSTALMHGISKATGLPCHQFTKVDSPPPPEYNVIWKFHSDFRNYQKEWLMELAGNKVVCKQHIPPTAHNLESLSRFNKVILLREPSDIIDAYFRANQKGIHAERTEFKGCRSLGQWRERAEEIGLKEDLHRFYKDWRAVEDHDTTMIINSHYLMENTGIVISEICDFLNVEQIMEVNQLPKKRYSRSKGLLALAKVVLRKWKNRYARK